MNKKLIISISVVVCVFVLGFGIYQSDASQADPNLSIEDVNEMVTKQYSGEITDVDLDKQNNRLVYEVHVNHHDRQYEIVLDGNNGEILKLKEKGAHKEQLHLEKDGKQHKDNQDDPQDDDQGKVENENKEKQIDNEQNKANTSNKTGIDAKQAIDIALNEFQGTITELELELEREDGRLIYEVEIKSENEEVEIEIDAHTGEIIVIDID